MATVVRVKRALEDEPAEAFVIAFKRKKTEDESSSVKGPDHEKTVLHFAGTVGSQDDNIASRVSKVLALKDNYTKLRQSYKQHQGDLTHKIREATKQASQCNRYKVVNCCRSLGADDDNDACNTKASSSAKQVVRVVDIASDDYETKNVSGDENKKDNFVEKKYVYDLYCTNTFDIDDGLIESMVSFQPIGSEVFLDNLQSDDDTPVHDDDDDSNDENNWRNDYPDSDADFGLEDDFYRGYEDKATSFLEEKVRKCTLRDEYELSDDDGEEDYCYGYSPTNDDVNRYGSSYAKYKAKVQAEFADEVEEVSDEEEQILKHL